MQATNLTQTGVSILQVMEGLNHRKGYVNNVSGRLELEAECPQEIVNEVLAVWGDTPTVAEPEPAPELSETVALDPRDLAIAQLMRDVAALKGGNAGV